MAIQGLRDTANWATDERPLNWREGILLSQEAGMSPLFALTAAMKSRQTDDPQFHWWEKNLEAQRLELPASAVGTTGTITITSGDATVVGIRPGHILLFEETGELVRVTATAAITLTVTRSIGAVAATTFTPAAGVNRFALVVGTAFEEGSSKPVSFNFDPTKRQNFCQIFRHNTLLSETAVKTNLRTADPVREQKREILQYHSAEIERAMFWGEPQESTVNGSPMRTTGGVIDRIADGPAENDKTFGATTTLAQLETELEIIFRFGSQEKMAFCGNIALLVINQIVRRNSQFQLMQAEKEAGLRVSRLVTPFGVLVLKTHPIFNQITTKSGDTYEAYNRAAVILDMAELKYVNMRGRDTHWVPNQELPGDDRFEGGYMTECALEVHHPRHHGIWRGFTAAAVDT